MVAFRGCKNNFIYQHISISISISISMSMSMTIEYGDIKEEE